MKNKTVLIIQELFENKWFDTCTLGSSIKDVVEELHNHKLKNPDSFFRVIERTTTIEEKVINL